jgi:hypothetical protein
VIGHKKRPGTVLALLVSALFAASLLVTPVAAQTDEGVLHQVGTYDYLTQPDFTGLATVGEIAEGRTFGLGTFTNLDGELVMLGGEVYRVRPDGVPRIVPAMPPRHSCRLCASGPPATRPSLRGQLAHSCQC